MTRLFDCELRWSLDAFRVAFWSLFEIGFLTFVGALGPPFGGSKSVGGVMFQKYVWKTRISFPGFI